MCVLNQTPLPTPLVKQCPEGSADFDALPGLLLLAQYCEPKAELNLEANTAPLAQPLRCPMRPPPVVSHS